ncbi:MAG: methyltransferase domain-containing protein [Candidatus Competibacteraceae bacterium]|nr:MAG: methyltransferase domain-containing protein [Candidatus Competibacteraceae bacterium]
MPSKIRILAGRGARFLYCRLPLPLPVKWRIKSFLYRHLGSLLKGSASYQHWLLQTAATRPATVQAPNPATVLPPPPPPPPMVEIGPEGVIGPQPASSDNPLELDGDPVRLIAFYLPQYHPIPENDHWWGKGFTEWTNVTKAVPNFVGHYQPRLPADLGFYDLRVSEVRDEQAALARQYGIYGFCYYYYWFAGKRLLNRPLDEVVQSGRPDFPFCVCWANENWSRRWDGLDAEILIAQEHSDEDDLNFIKSLEPALRDRRYIRINGRPLFLVYQPSLLPDAARTAELWHGYCREAGLGELYLTAVQSFGFTDDPRGFGFDAAVEFPPHAMAVLAEPPAEILNPDFQGRFYDYVATAEFFMNRPPMPYPFFRTAMPSWDNTARRQDNSDIFLNTAPEYYQRWLKHLVEQTRQFRFGDERMVFINAWNEWAEGNHLEPDRKFGHQYLEATKEALALPHSQSMAATDSTSGSDSNTDIFYLENSGYCPICEKEVTFRSNDSWLRDNYLCSLCNTIPRQRALIYFLNLFRPGWKSQYIHESSPSLDYFLTHCPRYTFSHYFTNVALGSIYNNVRCENLEQMTFKDESFDIFITQDVMEHVFNPDKVFAEIMRVLKPGGIYIFTAPKHKYILNSYPRATLKNGEVIHNLPSNYHGNPIGDGKSLVTWDYGCDFDDLVKNWSSYNLSTLVLRDRDFGIDGEFIEVFILKKDLANRLYLVSPTKE